MKKNPFSVGRKVKAINVSKGMCCWCCVLLSLKKDENVDCQLKPYET